MMSALVERISIFLEERFHIPRGRVRTQIRRFFIGIAAFLFVLVATLIVSFDSIFLLNSINTLNVGDVAPRDIVAPTNTSPYVSEVLTELRRQEERLAVQPIFDPPDPDVARQQTQLAQQILEYLMEIRADRYGTTEQRTRDLSAITAISLAPANIETILQLDEDTWGAVEDEIINVLSRVMRQEIRPAQVSNIRVQLNNQVNTTIFNNRESAVIVDIIDDLVLPNTFENIDATELARQTVADNVEPVTRSFVGGEIIVRERQRVDDLVHEALVALNLLQPEDVRIQEIVRGIVASILTMVVAGLYLSRYSEHLLYHEPQRLVLIAVSFLTMMILVRFLGVNGDIYLFPFAALALLYVSITEAHVAVIASLGLAFLTGLIMNDSLQITTLIAAGSIIGTLALRRAERLNSFFVAGALVGVINAAVVITFSLATPAISSNQIDFTMTVVKTLMSGMILVPATAIAAMYIVTMLFNLPTPLRLIDLSQPNKPLLQRLLREAPGTYQHSLQVANLAEQAANAIGADAQLTHVAALYHDIGKMMNPLYFTENQQDIGNPHDTLNDPYRSADIIISHVTEGDELAKQYRLPSRIRDFIREHHGTTEVYVFYQRALNDAEGDASAADIADFTYPGPRPRSRETAILMMADSCEAAVRSTKPQSKQEISDLITRIIDGKRASGQLDDAGLTLNDLRTIRDIFADILQGMFHPRINYKDAIAKKPEQAKVPKPAIAPIAKPALAATNGSAAKKDESKPRKPTQRTTPEAQVTPPRPVKVVTEENTEIADEEPIREVPRLPSVDELRTTNTFRTVKSDNGIEKDAKKPEDK